MKTLKIAFASLALCALAVGCGPKVSYGEKVEQGELTDSDLRIDSDNSPYDEYKVRLGQGDRIRLTVSSTDFDAYAFLVPPDGSKEHQNDDCEPESESTDACIDTTAHVAGEWTIMVNTYDDSGRGNYTLVQHVSKN